MRLGERVIRLAARALPRARREVRLEEWLADLEGCAELGLSTWIVPLGAVRDVATVHNLRNHVVQARRRTWVVLGLTTLATAFVGVPAVAVAAYAFDQIRGVVTTETSSDGADVTVRWRDYPAIAGVDTGALLASPSLEDGLLLGARLVSDIRTQLDEAIPQLDWEQEAAEGTVQPAPNQFGGTSMLYIVNSPAWVSPMNDLSSVPSESVIAAIREVGERYSFTEFRLDPAELGQGARFASGRLSDASGQWLAFAVGVLPGQGAAAEVGSITISYGANGLLPESDRAEFERRLSGFLLFEQPEPQTS